MSVAYIMAGIPATNASLYRQLRFSVGDPAVLLILPTERGPSERILMLRDIEMQRARQSARVDRVTCPAEFRPDRGLSGDRETATAQAAAELLVQRGIGSIVADRSLPLIYAHQLRQRNIQVQCDTQWGVMERRQKDQQEIDWLQAAQTVTESAMRMACELIASADTDEAGRLIHEGSLLTCQRVRSQIDHFLLDQNFRNPPSIVAAGPTGADCHNTGTGEIVSGQPVIVDIFPQDRATHYYGDCTRTVVHGEVSEQLQTMHAAVLAAKAAAIEAVGVGVTGEAVHQAAIATIRDLGFSVGLPAEDSPLDYCAMTHGTGHGVGLDVHEPPLLDSGGPPLVLGDAITIEPGLYRRDLGGIRVEDMVIVTEQGSQNLNRLPEGLSWA